MCKWCDENDEMMGCQDCGRLLCWDVKGHDDIISSPYVSASGDVYCEVCGPEYDKEEDEGYDMYDGPIEDIPAFYPQDPMERMG